MYQKAIFSGRVVELFEYEKVPLNIGRKVGTRNKKKYRRSVLASFERRKDNYRRVKRDFERLVYTTLADRGKPYLLTLTMRQVCTLKEAYSQYTQFSRRLSRLFPKYTYIVVPEFQERGAVHFHALIWGIPEVVCENERKHRTIQHYWGLGYVDCKPTDGSERLAGYLSKYMSKAVQDYRLVGQKAYSRSRGMLSPTSFNSEKINSLSIALESVGLSHTAQLGKITVDKKPDSYGVCDTLWLGKCRYSRYQLD